MDVFTGYPSLVDSPFNTWKMLCHVLPISMVSYKKSTVIWIVLPLGLFKIFFFVFIFRSLIMMCVGMNFFESVLLSFLTLWVYISPVWGNFQLLFYQTFSSPTLYCLSRTPLTQVLDFFCFTPTDSWDSVHFYASWVSLIHIV